MFRTKRPQFLGLIALEDKTNPEESGFAIIKDELLFEWIRTPVNLRGHDTLTLDIPGTRGETITVDGDYLNQKMRAVFEMGFARNDDNGVFHCDDLRVEILKRPVTDHASYRQELERIVSSVEFNAVIEGQW